MVADCPKFIPNIFNNTKCSSCFKTREEHGDVALDSKSLRKVVKCGYLFVAPGDWDFCNPTVYRAKRWQRRWFVLWSDDQLTWSIDDQPDTIPQGTLDMREILEIKGAEEITENPYSLALTGKGSTFIKGMNNEDIKSWQSVLSKYGNRLIVTGNGKRSLTLPGGFSSNSTTRFETGVVIGPSRPRFHSVTSATAVGLPLSSPTNTYGKCLSAASMYSSSSGSPPSPPHEPVKEPSVFISASPIISVGAVVQKTSTAPVPPPASKAFQEKYEASTSSTKSSATTTTSRSLYLSLSNVPKGYRNFSTTSPLSTSTISPPQLASSEEDNVPPSSSPPRGDKCFRDSEDSVDCPTHSVRAQRGDPDGCGGLEPSDSGPLRKGWLLRQTNHDWNKHWFVLQNNSLNFYENSEELQQLGSIEINEDTIIRMFESSRHYGFELLNKSSPPQQLSAITNGMRGIWMKALEGSKTRPRSLEEIHRSSSPPPAPNSSSSSSSSSTSTTVANPPSPPLKSKKSRWRKKTELKLFDSLKDEFKERERELEALRSSSDHINRVDSPRMRELLKSQSLQIDNLRTQLTSGFMEIEKMELYLKARELEYNESLKCKDEIIEEIKEDLSREIHLREKLMEKTSLLEHQVDLLTQQTSELKRVLRSTEEEADLESIHAKELESLLERSNAAMSHELQSLTQRCNDLVEKLYQSEKTGKSLKSKLGRVKSQSLKDRQIESDVLHKISDLEEKLLKLDAAAAAAASPLSPSCPSDISLTSVTSPVPCSPVGVGPGGVVNVIMKLNDLDQRVEKAVDSLWFRRGELEGDFVGGGAGCENCRILEEELQEREERLEALEENLMHLETDFKDKVKELKEFVKEQPPSGEHNSPTSAQAVSKYQAEIEQLRNLCAKGLEAMENSHRRMVLEIEEKHRRELQTLRIEKENELAEETKATLSALDAMRKNHQAELQKEIAKFKEEFITKFKGGQDLNLMHKEHEQELTEVKEEILRLSEKYSVKCVEASKLEETIAYLKTQLNEAKRRILDLEGSDVHSIISCASSANKKPDQVTALRSRLEQLILNRPVHETKTKTQNEQTTYNKGGGGRSSTNSTDSTPKKPRHSTIMRSPSCPKLGEARLTLLQE